MARHRSPGGEQSTPAGTSEEDSAPVRTSARRAPTPPSVLRGRIVVAAVAAGAFAAAGQAMAAEDGTETRNDDHTPLASGRNAAASFGSVAAGDPGGSDSQQSRPQALRSQGPRPAGSDEAATGVGGGVVPAPEVLPVAQPADQDSELSQIDKSQRIAEKRAEARAARLEALREARQPDFVMPAEGVFTSGFGGRWGTTHYGIDIANNIGTEIVAAAEGTVIEAGPASGFGLWVRVLHDDGTVTVYGHVHSITVSEGERVEAGEQIATMGNRGFSTGSHLHFEVWNASGMKINPVGWLNEHGVYVPGAG